MNVTDFNFELPPELIAQDPLEDRAASRLLVLDKKTGEMEHRHFRDILQYLKKGDCLVINDPAILRRDSFPSSWRFLQGTSDQTEKIRS